MSQQRIARNRCSETRRAKSLRKKRQPAGRECGPPRWLVRTGRTSTPCCPRSPPPQALSARHSPRTGASAVWRASTSPRAGARRAAHGTAHRDRQACGTPEAQPASRSGRASTRVQVHARGRRRRSSCAHRAQDEIAKCANAPPHTWDFALRSAAPTPAIRVLSPTCPCPRQPQRPWFVPSQYPAHRAMQTRRSTRALEYSGD
jgi:hypothetical protein